MEVAVSWETAEGGSQSEDGGGNVGPCSNLMSGSFNATEVIGSCS